MSDPKPPSPTPELRILENADIIDSLKKGFADFRRTPGFGLFFSAVFSVIGVMIFAQLFVWESSYWVLPLAAGFPLIGPFVAVGLYDVSRRLERGETPDWPSVLTAVWAERERQIPTMAFVVLFFFLIWVYLAHLVFALSFGLTPLTNVMSSFDIFLTSEGLTMLIAGTIVGGGIAAVLFSISVISIPMFIDRELDVVTGMVTSVQCVLRNKGPMLLWGLCVTALTIVAMVPMFLGMLVIFPVIGHASWHLYRHAVEPEGAETDAMPDQDSLLPEA